jgi:large subunit ribosomal protein L31
MACYVVCSLQALTTFPGATPGFFYACCDIITRMKASLHPKYNSQTKITCSCGNVIVTGSTKSDYAIDICSNCHPFFTGEHRFIDTQGRVEKFQLKQKAAVGFTKKSKSDSQNRPKEDKASLTLKEMLSTKTS